MSPWEEARTKDFSVRTPRRIKRLLINRLKQIGMEEMARRSYSQLSGGEKQRVIIARVLAQRPEILILDEPTNHLDVHHQLKIFDLIKKLDVTVIAAIHDLNIAALYCDRVYVLNNGEIYESGPPEKVFTPQLIYEVYGVKADVAIHPVTKKASITYLPGGLDL